MVRSIEKTHCSNASRLSPDIVRPVSFLADSPLAWEAEKLLEIPTWTHAVVC